MFLLVRWHCKKPYLYKLVQYEYCTVQYWYGYVELYPYQYNVRRELKFRRSH